MGYYRHHAIVVTSMFEAPIEAAHAFAVGTGAEVSPVSAKMINGFRSFAVFPDGSKEGWADSDKGNTRRNKIVEQLSGSACDWVEVSFGGDDPEPAIERGQEDDDEDDFIEQLG